MVFQLLYHSHFLPVGAGPSSTIRAILRASEDNNFRDGITGFLIFDKTSFIQVLEGEQAAVLATFDRIGDDPRHTGVAVIAARTTETRAFAGWAMGGHLRSVETQDIYARHGLGDGLDPSSLRAPQVIALAQDLQAFETQRQSQRTIGAA